MKRVTLKEVAAYAGVHLGTVSRALNEESRHLVNPVTLEKVLEAAEILGYSPNLSARTLRTAQSMAIGMLLPDLTNPLYPPIARGVEDVLRLHGYTTWLANTDNDEDLEAASIDAFVRRGVDGFVLATARLHDNLVTKMSAGTTPLVLVSRKVSRSDIPSVTTDDDYGISLAIDHLVELGHRDIIHLAEPSMFSSGAQRKRAFLYELESRGLPWGPERVLQCGATSLAEGRRVLGRALDEERIPFTAVVAGNDLIALGCYEALRAHEKTCPHDVSVVGFNDMPFMDHVAPSMTTVRVPQYQLGGEAARLLVSMLDTGERNTLSIVLPSELVVRQSTAPPPI